jgi:hypothetical protein
MVRKYVERPRKHQIASQHTAKRHTTATTFVMTSFGQIHKYISAKISVSSMCCLSVRHLSAVIESRTSERIFIKFHTEALEWLPMCVEMFIFSYTLQQQWTLRMIFPAYFEKYLQSEKYFERCYVEEWNTQLCPVHFMPRRCVEEWNTQLCPVHYMPRRCVEEWNTQFCPV